MKNGKGPTGVEMQVCEVFKDIKIELDEVNATLFKCLKTDLEKLNKSYLQLIQAGGKRIRPACTVMCAQYGNAGKENIVPLASAFELIHMASLVHDDVIDCSQTRRGKPTIKALYGNDFSLHQGDTILAQGLSMIEIYKIPRLNTLVAQTSVEMCRGEIQQIALKDNYQQSLRTYLSRIKRKTALLISLCCQAGALAGGAPPPTAVILGRFGYYLGMAFQITDDILDYLGDEKTLGKPVGHDLQGGIVTLPLIAALQSGDQEVRDHLLLCLAGGSKSQTGTAAVMNLVFRTPAISYSWSLADKYIKKCQGQLDLLPDVPTTQSLRELAKFVQSRKY